MRDIGRRSRQAGKANLGIHVRAVNRYTWPPNRCTMSQRDRAFLEDPWVEDSDMTPPAYRRELT